MIFLFYRVLQALFAPAILVYFFLRGLRDRRYFATLHERLGGLPPLWKQTAAGSIWLHAVSVGEVLAAIPLVREIRDARPKIPIFVSTTTLAGRLTADTRLTGLVDGVFYAPIDAVWCVRRVIRHLQPSLLIVMETEIWPNFFREMTRLGAGLAIVNARISDRALPRYKKFRGVFGAILPLCDRILAQSDEMASRYVALGAAADRVSVTGNLKYDFTPTETPADSPIHAFLNARESPLWIAASTSAGGTSADDNGNAEDNEETAVLNAQRQLAGWRLIVAPRKPERFEEVARMLSDSGLRWTRRTALDDPDADVLLLDSIGELGGLFGYAQAVFMGGSLVRKGGHNILEPAFFNKAVIVGPHMENFREIADDFLAQGALLKIRGPEALAGAVQEAVHSPWLGERAGIAARAKRGATTRTLDILLKIYDTHYPSIRPPQPLFALGWLLSQLWRIGSAYDRKRKLARRRRLPIPVASIGNITVGGTGKTPVTIELLERLTREGFAAGLLMRGHRRSSSRPVILTALARLPISQTGDEAQLYHARLNVPVGIYRDRYTVGMQLIGETGISLALLDDGFQHLQLERNFDVVLIDALHPFGGGYLLPLGRLREPLEGLARADAFLITRSDEASGTAAIEHMLRRYNADAPIFHSRTVARGWQTFGGLTATLEEVTAGPILAFCGLGNPNSFWRTLKQLEVAPVEHLEYDDHHRYTPVEMRRMIRHAADIDAKILLTTAKDAVNLCEGCEELVAPLKLYWLDIGVGLDDNGFLLDRLRSMPPIKKL